MALRIVTCVLSENRVLCNEQTCRSYNSIIDCICNGNNAASMFQDTIFYCQVKNGYKLIAALGKNKKSLLSNYSTSLKKSIRNIQVIYSVIVLIIRKKVKIRILAV